MRVGRLYEDGPLKDSYEIARKVGTMISSEVQRTLVKSPPELWAEISDPESLARHLGEFGEIRITRVQPEQKVEWEADDASGTVVIKPSGWGTKVKLTVTRELAQPEPAGESSVAADDQLDDEPSAHTTEQVADEPEQDGEHERDATPPSVALDPQDEPDAEADAQPEAETDAQAETDAVAELDVQRDPEPRRSFFARLFGRRRARPEEPSSVELAEPEPQPIADEPIDEPLLAGLDAPECDLVDDPVREHEPAPGATADEPTETGAQPLGELASGTGTTVAEQTIDVSEDSADRFEQQAVTEDAATRAKLAEELVAEEVTAVLTGVLDRLGAAHHRPFSRA